MTTITLNTSDLEAKLSAVQKVLDPASLMAGLDRKLRSTVSTHLRENYATKTNKLGGVSTGYWLNVIDSIATTVGPDSVRLDMSERGLRLHLEGGTVEPKGISEITGKKITRLSIPVTAEAHGKSIKEIPGLDFGKWDKGYGLGKDGKLYFIMARSVTIKPDPKIIPLDLEQTLTVWIDQQLPQG